MCIIVVHAPGDVNIQCADALLHLFPCACSEDYLLYLTIFSMRCYPLDTYSCASLSGACDVAFAVVILSFH